MFNGVETKAANMPGVEKIKVKPELVYSICTENRCPIMINNLAVIAWDVDEWTELVKSRNLTWKDNLQ